MYIYLYTYVYIHIYRYIHVYIHMYIYICECTSMHNIRVRGTATPAGVCTVPPTRWAFNYDIVDSVMWSNINVQCESLLRVAAWSDYARATPA